MPPPRDSRWHTLSIAFAAFASWLALELAGRIHTQSRAVSILTAIALSITFAAAVFFVDRHSFVQYSALRKEHKMLRALIDSIPDSMYVKDASSRFVLANAHLARVAGVKSPNELLGKTEFDFFPKKLAATLFEDEQKMMRSGQPSYNHEQKVVDSAGNEIHVLITRVPLRDSGGQVTGIASVGRDISARKITGIASVGRDISARKKLEDSLWEAERRYHGIFDKAIIGIFQSTPAGRLLRANPAMAAIFGYASPGEMMTLLTDLARQSFVDSKRCEEFLHLMEDPGEVQNFECEVFRKDGSKIWLSLSVRAFFQHGVAIRHDGMCEDITERKMLRSQLLQAQKLEAVGQLAAGIAHEINTPTQYIGDNVRFLKDAFLELHGLLTNYERLLLAVQRGALSAEALQEIQQAVERSDAGFLLEEIPKAIDQTLEGVTQVSTLVNAMKEFSHPGSKEKTPLDLNHAIQNTLAVSHNEWKYVADIETDFDPSLPLIPCLPGEFNQVILNLIVNAAQAIGDAIRKDGTERGKIRVQTRNFPNCVEIQIQDTGTGIPEAVRTRVFDPFFTTKEIGKGTGQGLAIARSVIVDKHNGSIEFETTEGKGTTFIIRLPHEGKVLDAGRMAA